ncbi:single-stranded DNA-binding protein [Catelliglobosispora koreensis]|uniref:single-stranded DNA-binding protein n=1 Tax=Catelliglobosispora koreensis TaxID=129052 RepID=UPI000362BD6B|nr:single-stranded DNA-binding protein [Catelliglobosispora koreensis]
MSLFTVVIEGRLAGSPETGATRQGREYTQFPFVYRDSWRDAAGVKRERVMHFEVICWGDLATRAYTLKRGDQITVEAGQMLAYVDHDLRRGDQGAMHERCGQPVLKLSARNISISMRHGDAHSGLRPAAQRRGDMVTTAHGEQVPADAYPEITADLELVHHH